MVLVDKTLDIMRVNINLMKFSGHVIHCFSLKNSLRNIYINNVYCNTN